jgi:hypothetical protein
MRRAYSAIGLAVLFGCSSAPVAIAPTPMNPIRRIAIQRFEGKGGADVSAALTEALGSSFQIVRADQSPEALLGGRMSEAKWGPMRLIFLGETSVLAGDHAVAVQNPVVLLDGARQVPKDAAGQKNPHIVIEGTAAAAAAYLQTPDGVFLWRDEFRFEGLDPVLNRRAVAISLARSLERAAPRLRRAKSS